MFGSVVVAREGEGLREIPFEEIGEAYADEANVVWVRFLEASDDVADTLERVFGIHPLLIEDAFHDAITPKLEDHGRYIYLIMHGLHSEKDGDVRTEDIDLFIGDRFLVTHDCPRFAAVDKVVDAVKAEPALLASGPSTVAHRIMDALVDELLPAMDRLVERVNRVERTIFDLDGSNDLEQIFRMKRSLERLNRTTSHQTLVLERLVDDIDHIDDAVRPFYRDIYDHTVRLHDRSHIYKEVLASAIDAQLTVQGHRLNEVMKVLTLISTIMLPLTFVTGLYGMNFDYMPLIHWKYGYEFAWVLMLGTAAGFWYFARRRKWW